MKLIIMADERKIPMFLVNLTDFDNFTEDQYLETMLGPKHLPMRLVLPVTVIYVLIFVTGVFGNAVTCAVIIKNSAMQTATNHYLFNLALSDLMLLVLGLPNELWVFWQQYPWELGVTVCKGRAFISETSSYVSVLTIVAFSLERYLAICHPLRFYVMSGLKRHMFIIAAVWIMALVFALPFGWYTEVHYVEWPPNSSNISRNSAICAMLNIPHLPLYEMSCFIFFLAPMVIILWLYVRMGLAIQSTTLEHKMVGTVHGETRPSQSRKAIIRMLSAVVVTFFLCWAPFHVQRLLWVYADQRTFAGLNEWLYPLTGSLYYFSTTINPILYNVMSAKYRRAFKQTLRCSTSTNHHFHADLEMSTMRGAAICRCGSLRNPQIVRVQSVIRARTNKNGRDHLRFSLPGRCNEIHHNNHHQNHNYGRSGMPNLQVPTNTLDEPGSAVSETEECSMRIASNNGHYCRSHEKLGRDIFSETQI